MAINQADAIFSGDPYKNQGIDLGYGILTKSLIGIGKITGEFQNQIALKIPSFKAPTLQAKYPEKNFEIEAGAQIIRAEIILPDYRIKTFEYIYGIHLPDNSKIIASGANLNLKLTSISTILTNSATIPSSTIGSENIWLAGSSSVLVRNYAQADAANSILNTISANTTYSLVVVDNSNAQVSVGNGIKLLNPNDSAYVIARIIYQIPAPPFRIESFNYPIAIEN